jgi:GNAT superfamily N-acetyltransferase
MLRLQEEGVGQYLVAWADDLPVGVAVVAWGAQAVSSHARLEGSAELRTIEALDGHRRHGVGAALLKGIESAALESGASRIGLQVGLDNTVARAFYEKMGYHDAGHGLFQEEVVSDNEQDSAAVCQYLIKKLTP